MNCQEALNILYDIIDREASQIDVHQVEEHLAKCKDCSGVYEVEHSIARLIKERLANPEPTPNFAKLKATVLKQLDEIDTENC